jgi:hypothetical protein
MSRRVTVKIELVYNEAGDNFEGLLPDEVWALEGDEFVDALDACVAADLRDLMSNTDLQYWAEIETEEVA